VEFDSRAGHDLGGEEDPQAAYSAGEAGTRIAGTIAPFLKPKELRAISLRYGLEVPAEPAPLRDYEGEVLSALIDDNILPPEAPAGKKGYDLQNVERTLDEVGVFMNVSGEYVRRLLKSGLAKLRIASESGRLAMDDMA
jgi:DNA-directed RNA polymerase sigma subunit (sigma70/sigma32)